MLPVLIPVIAVTTLYGAKKGYDAKEKMDRAERIVKRAKRKIKEKETYLRSEGDRLNAYLDDFARYKLNIFTVHIKNMVELIKECKSKASSELDNDKAVFTPEEVKELESSVDTALEISSGLAKGAASGVLTAFGAYSSVGLLASASTGTAIATLSGAAATNATLAWLGGGSLAAGGFGVAGGMVMLGGIVAGPAIAVTGLVMDSKAEESLTDAKKFSAEADIAAEKIDDTVEKFEVIKKRADELQNVIKNITARFVQKFEELRQGGNICVQESKIESILLLGKSLKDALSIPILAEDGNLDKNFAGRLKSVKEKVKVS